MALPINQVLSHWGQAFPFCTMSAIDFYNSVHTIIKSHEFPDLKMTRVNMKEGGALSSSREYFRIKYKELIFDICAMQFGKDFCITSWLYETESGTQTLFKYTWIGKQMRGAAANKTMYQADKRAMFKFCVHNAVLEAIDKMTQEKGIRGLTDIQRQMS